MAVMLLATAVPAFAAPKENSNANCVGENAAMFNELGKKQFGLHGLGGTATSNGASGLGGLGQFASKDYCSS